MARRAAGQDGWWARVGKVGGGWAAGGQRLGGPHCMQGAGTAGCFSLVSCGSWARRCSERSSGHCVGGQTARALRQGMHSPGLLPAMLASLQPVHQARRFLRGARQHLDVHACPSRVPAGRESEEGRQLPAAGAQVQTQPAAAAHPAHATEWRHRTGCSPSRLRISTALKVSSGNRPRR